MNRTAITLTSILFALAISAPADADKKSDKASDDAPAEAAKAAKAENASPAPAPETAKISKAAKAAPAAAPSDDLWFEAPLVAGPVAAPALDSKKAKAAKVAAPRYGLDLGLHNARNKREAPKVEERAEDMSRKLTQNQIRQVIRDQHDAISFCGRYAAKKKERANQVLLRFEVDSKGAARDMSVTDVSGNAQPVMSTCVSRSARSWKFPADTAGGSIEFPLMLNRR